jgi:hypothetical protein
MKKISLILLIIAFGLTAFGQLDTINIGATIFSGGKENLRSISLKVNRAVVQQNTVELYNVTSPIQTQLNSKAEANDTISIAVGVPFIVLTPSVSPPGSPVEGMIYMDTDHHLYVYNASIWVQIDN